MANIPGQSIHIAQGSQEGRSYTPALIVLAVLYFMMGFITCMNDTLVPLFKKGFTLSYVESSLVQFYFFLTYGIMSLPASRIVERLGYKNGMVAGFIVTALGALLFFPAAVVHQYYFFLIALFVLAVGIVLLQVAANPYITSLGPPETASSRLTLIQGVGAVGTTVAPIFGGHFILAGLEQHGHTGDAVKYPYIGIAGLLLLIAVIVFLLKLPDMRAAAREAADAGEGRHILSFRNLKWGIPGIFAYVGAEVSIGTFLTSYVTDTLHIPENEANRYVAFYWGGMIVGRFAGLVMLRFAHSSKVLAVCAVAAVVLILVSVNTGGYTAVVTMIAVGLCNAIMFAIIFSLSVEGLGAYTTRASGLLASAITGGAVISLLEGYVKDIADWRMAFMVPLACYVYIIFYGVNGYKPK